MHVSWRRPERAVPAALSAAALALSAAVLALSAAALLVLLVPLARPAEAATVLRMRSVPDRPVAGSPALVRFTTLAPTISNGDQPSALPASYPWRIEVVAPGGPVGSMRVARTSEPTVWEGSFTPATAGTWTVRVTNFAPRYEPGDGAVLKVPVVARDAGLPSTGGPGAALAVAGGSLLLVGAGLLATARRRGRWGWRP